MTTPPRPKRPQHEVNRLTPDGEQEIVDEEEEEEAMEEDEINEGNEDGRKTNSEAGG